MKAQHDETRSLIDFSERSGFLAGKSAALADWAFRKEQRAFNRQIAVLRANKWNREHPDRRAEIAARYNAQPDNRARANALARARSRKRHDDTVYICEGCGAQWCRVPGTRGLAGAGRFCTNACRMRHRYATDAEYREKRKAEAREMHARKKDRR